MSEKRYYYLDVNGEILGSFANLQNDMPGTCLFLYPPENMNFPKWNFTNQLWENIVTSSDLIRYKKQKFDELNSKIQSKFMYIKKIKKLDDVRSDFIDEYKKSHASLEEVDASITFIETDLFEV